MQLNPFSVASLMLAALGLHATATASDDYRWDGISRVIAFSDVHGAYDELVDLLTDLELIDDHASWIGGVTHLVSTGDLLDRGADSRKVMDLLMELQQQAQAAGGRVHVTLGNHEIMNVYGDLRYVIADEYLAYADEADTQKREKFRSEHDDAEFEKKYPPGFFTHRAMFEPMENMVPGY